MPLGFLLALLGVAEDQLIPRIRFPDVRSERTDGTRRVVTELEVVVERIAVAERRVPRRARRPACSQPTSGDPSPDAARRVVHFFLTTSMKVL